MSSVFLQDLTINENVIQVNLTELMKTFEQHIIDIMLKERRFISQFKEHYFILVDIEESNKDSQILAFETHAKFIECNDNVKLSQILTVLNLS
jgi:hypothetical protein